MIDLKRVGRTAIQVGAGAGVALVQALAADFELQGVKVALVEFVVAVAVAVLMNIKNQMDECEV